LLIKTNCTRYEKEQFILEGKVHPNMKNKNIAIVALRNAYKILGAKFVKNGRYVDDDYYEQAALRNGFVRGAPAVVAPYQSKAEADDDPSGLPRRPASSLTFVPKALQDTFKDKEPKTQFGPASHPPFARWDPAEKKKRPGPFTLENWQFKYAQSTSMHNKEIQRWREEQFVSVPLQRMPEADPKAEPDVKVEPSATEGMDVDPADPGSAVELAPPEQQAYSAPLKHPAGRIDTHTNLPHVRLVTQPSSATWELVDPLPCVADDDTPKLRRTAARAGMYSVEYASEVVVMSAEVTQERENILEDAGWPRLPGAWDFAM
jgi:chromatin structure-remodeling complex protein RSC7